MEQDKREIEIVEAVIKGEVVTPEDIADKFNLLLPNVITVLNSPTFITMLSGFNKAKANLFVTTKAYPKLEQFAESDDAKESLPAIKMISQIAGAIKGDGNNTYVNLNLGSLIEREEKRISTSPLQLEEVKSQIIDIQNNLEKELDKVYFSN